MMPPATAEASPFSAIDEIDVARLCGSPTLVRAACASITAQHLRRPCRWPPAPGYGGLPAVVGGAVDVDAEQARRRAAGELWERYAASFPSVDLVGRARTTLPGPSVGLEDILDGSRDAAFAHELPSAETELDWVLGADLARGTATWLPAEAVYLPYVDPSGRVDRHWAWTSNGLAAGATVLEATRSALLEVIERDAFMRHWLARRPATPVPERWWRRRLPAPIAEAVAACHPWRLRLARLDTDAPVAVVLAALVNPDRFPAMTLAAACRFDQTAAARAAALEVLYARSCTPAVPPAQAGGEGADLPRSFNDRALLYGQPDRLDAVGWLLDGDARPVDGDGRTADGVTVGLADLVRTLDRQGLRSYAVDLTSRDAAAAGYAVVRVIVPGTQLLEADHRARIVNLSRLGVAADAVNQVPHPFP